MANVKPFNAYRPDPAFASEIAALPYDVYNRSEASEAVKNKPYSFLRIDRAETAFSDDVDTYDDRVYQKADALLNEFIEKGYYIKEEKPVYYIYALTMDGRTQTGLVICAAIDDYLNGVILKHENTREEKELDRIRHVDTLSAQTGPIFLAYRANETISEVVGRNKAKTPLYSFTSEDDIKHEAWIIDDDKDVLSITEAFKDIRNLYIADGHHRAASAVKVGVKRRKSHPDYNGSEEFNYFLSVLFPDDELMIMDYNRMVKDLCGLSITGFLEQVGEKFDIEKKGTEPYKPQEKGTIGMYLIDTWYKLTAKREILSDDPVDGLDVSILQNEILDPILDIKDPKTDDRIEFIGGIRGLGELEKRVKEAGTVAFAMYPTDISELFAVADAGLLMPPKSTWFEPKLRSGLFIHKIER